MSKRVSFAAEDVESEVEVDSDPDLPSSHSYSRHCNAISLGSGENLRATSRPRRRRHSVNLLKDRDDNGTERVRDPGVASDDDEDYHHESDIDLNPTSDPLEHNPFYTQDIFSSKHESSSKRFVHSTVNLDHQSNPSIRRFLRHTLDDDDYDDDNNNKPPKKKAQAASTPASTRASASKAKAKVAEEPKTPTPTRKRKTAEDFLEDAPGPSNKKNKTAASASVNSENQPLMTRVRKTSAKEGGIDMLPIPKTEEEMTAPDRMIWDERQARASSPFTYATQSTDFALQHDPAADIKGKGWNEISEQWYALTGQKPASTTLPNRLTRIHENIGDWTDEDDPLMLKCHDEIVETFEKEVFAMTAEQIITKGGPKSSALSVEKRWRELNTTEVKDDGENDSERDGDEVVRGVAPSDE